jgi:hypothetical protein
MTLSVVLSSVPAVDIVLATLNPNIMSDAMSNFILLPSVTTQI